MKAQTDYNTYFANALRQAHAKINEINTRKLGPDADSEVSDLLATMNEHTERCKWFVDGSYGTEFAELVKQWVSMLPVTKKRRQAGLLAIARQSFIYCACLDCQGINPRKITSAFKKAGIDFAKLNQSCLDTIAETLTDYEA